uniref:Uncharacterized protein n=1 Tax=Candidatus Methanophagaceae archaeon ANME-1 ERB6 TaxID=2759912 RepID=A0A7G9YVQ7_9EURY|nr:hypothetical protein IPGHNFGK_00047 [Methanosarcinales archaeon ANME-1 ERB6]
MTKRIIPCLDTTFDEQGNMPGSEYFPLRDVHGWRDKGLSEGEGDKAMISTFLKTKIYQDKIMATEGENKNFLSCS